MADIYGQLVKAQLENSASDLSNVAGLIYYNTSTGLPKYYDGVGTAWRTLVTTATAMTNPLTTTGDIVYSSSGTTVARLGIGTAGKFLRSNGTIPGWDFADFAYIDTTNSNVTLTIDSYRSILFNSFSVTRDVTLPTTGIKAGEVFRLANSTAFAMVVKASGGNALTTANSTNMDATVQNGFVELVALQDTPTAATHWRVLNVVESTIVHTSNWVFVTSGTASNIVHHLSRRNREVTIFIVATGTIQATPGSASSMTMSTAIPTRFWPTNRVMWAVHVANAGADVNSDMGVLRLETNGVFTLFRTANAASFNTGAAAGFNGTFAGDRAFSWVVP